MTGAHYTSTRGGHPSSIVKVWGVMPYTRGATPLRLRGFRVHCPRCGYLGAVRDTIHKAQYENERHKRATRPETEGVIHGD